MEGDSEVNGSSSCIRAVRSAVGLTPSGACRWLKFEEDVEDGGERWSKPYVATLSLHSLFELRNCIIKGTVLLDMCANSTEEIAGTARCRGGTVHFKPYPQASHPSEIPLQFCVSKVCWALLWPGGRLSVFLQRGTLLRAISGAGEATWRIFSIQSRRLQSGLSSLLMEAWSFA